MFGRFPAGKVPAPRPNSFTNRKGLAGKETSSEVCRALKYVGAGALTGVGLNLFAATYYNCRDIGMNIGLPAAICSLLGGMGGAYGYLIRTKPAWAALVALAHVSYNMNERLNALEETEFRRNKLK